MYVYQEKGILRKQDSNKLDKLEETEVDDTEFKKLAFKKTDLSITNNILFHYRVIQFEYNDLVIVTTSQL